MARRLAAGLLVVAAVLAGCGAPRAPVTPGVVNGGHVRGHHVRHGGLHGDRLLRLPA
jgi:hypothetical protein